MTEIRSVYRPHSRQKPLDDPLAAARGIFNCLLFSLVFWVILAVLAALCFGAWADLGPL